MAAISRSVLQREERKEVSGFICCLAQGGTGQEGGKRESKGDCMLDHPVWVCVYILQWLEGRFFVFE